MRVHLIHGIHTEGVSPVQGLIPYLKAEGFEVFYPDYGWIAGLETRVVNPIIRGSILPYVGPGDVLIGHSNGCALAYDLMRSVGSAGVFINAALQQSIARPVSVRFIDVYYNSGDQITEAAKFAKQIGLVDPVWGEMGHAGYSGTDKAITNINCGLGTVYPLPGSADGSPIVGTGQPMPVVSGHSDFFTPSKLSAWGPFLAKRLYAELNS